MSLRENVLTRAAWGLLAAGLLVSASPAAERVVRAQGMTVSPGQTNRVLVLLEGLGNEKALGFSLAYDPDALTFVKAVRGAGSTNAGATLFVNANQTTNFGRIGLVCALDLSNTNSYPAGTNVIAEVFFTPVAGVTNGVTAITFTNHPVEVEFSDPEAQALAATLVGANVTVELVCALSLTTNAAAFPDAGGPGSVTLTASYEACGWSVENTNAWIAVTSPTNGMDSAVVDFSVAPNPALTARVGVMVIGGHPFTVTQQGIVCTYALTSAGQSHGVAAATNSFDVLVGSPCPWSVGNTNPWVSILAGASGAGGGTVTYAVTENTSIVARSGVLMIADQTFTITQQGVPCSYALTPAGRTHTAGAATSTIDVSAGAPCPWAVNHTNSWITILSGSNGLGPGTVTYSVGANASLGSRVGTLELAGQFFTVTQEAVVCAYALTPANRTHNASAITDTINVTVATPCPWSVVNTNPWITILSGSNGVGNGVVTYSLAANPISLDRAGFLTVAGQAFAVTQQGISCSYSVSPTRRAHGFGTASNFFTVTAGAGCLWTAVNTNPWITLINPSSGNGTLAVGYTVEANPFAVERIGNLMVQGATLLITQRATTCTYTIAPTNLALASIGGTGVVSVTTGAACSWTATTTNSWIALSGGTNGTGNGGFGWSAPANLEASARTGAVTVAGQTVLATQPGHAGGFAFSSMEISALGGVSLCITGGPAGVWELQASSDLVNWSKFADLTNSTGRVDFTAPLVPGTNQFFRTMLP